MLAFQIFKITNYLTRNTFFPKFYNHGCRFGSNLEFITIDRIDGTEL